MNDTQDTEAEETSEEWYNREYGGGEYRSAM